MKRLLALAVLTTGALAFAACGPDPAPAPEATNTSSASSLPDCDTVAINQDADPWNDVPCHPTDPVWNQPVIAKDPPPPADGSTECDFCWAD